MTTLNRRISPRRALETRVVFEDEFNEEFLAFTSKDISLSGIFLRTPLLLRPGTHVRIKFSLGFDEPAIRTGAVVSRRAMRKRGPGRKSPFDEGLGLKFLGLDPIALARIERFLSGE